MLRFAIRERDRPLPPIDVTDDAVIGSAASARVRLPAEAAQAEHVRFAQGQWRLIGEAIVDGQLRAAGESGAVGDGVSFELGGYRIAVSVAPVGVAATPPQRTESLARELVRSLLGDGAAPTLEVERGAPVGSRRMLPPPEARLVIGRGDEATWVILDEDLSRAHAEIRRGWDGVSVVDLGSKNGTRVDGAVVGGEPVQLHDGAALAIGRTVIRFRDPAERHLRGESVAAVKSVAVKSQPVASRSAKSQPASRWQFWLFVAIAVLALAAMIWILAS